LALGGGWRHRERQRGLWLDRSRTANSLQQGLLRNGGSRAGGGCGIGAGEFDNRDGWESLASMRHRRAAARGRRLRYFHCSDEHGLVKLAETASSEVAGGFEFQPAAVHRNSRTIFGSATQALGRSKGWLADTLRANQLRGMALRRPIGFQQVAEQSVEQVREGLGGSQRMPKIDGGPLLAARRSDEPEAIDDHAQVRGLSGGTIELGEFPGGRCHAEGLFRSCRPRREGTAWEGVAGGAGCNG